MLAVSINLQPAGLVKLRSIQSWGSKHPRSPWVTCAQWHSVEQKFRPEGHTTAIGDSYINMVYPGVW